MNQNIRLGKIGGVPIGVNWSVLLIFVLIAWELAALVLPGYRPGHSATLYWAVAVVTTVLFFGSLLAHEVSHAVVAKRNGIKVRRVTLWLFGGVSELESEALTPGADFRIAVVGPLTSFALAGISGAVALLLHTAGGAGAVVVSALGWLAWINILLGGFNLIPAAPLDGGRVLRAALWQRWGDRVRAATSATRSGEVFGYVLVVLGFLELFSVGIIGLWSVFLGWYLLTAARAEQTAVVMRTSLADVHVRDIMAKDPVTFFSTASVAELIDEQLHHHRFSSYPLVRPDGYLEGLTTTGRIRHVPAHLRGTTRLIDTACPMTEVPVANPNESVPDLLVRMQASPDGRALVIDSGGHLVGIVSPSDIARYVQLSMLQSAGRPARNR